jgi:Ni/Fe-hydrogenase subunit HybB-like protein
LLRPLFTLAAVISGAALITFAIVQYVAPGKRDSAHLADAAYTGHSGIIYESIDIYMIEAALYESEKSSLTFGEDEIIDYLLMGEVDFSLIYEHLGDGTEL